MTVLECEGGIMHPDSLPERAAEFDDTGLIYMDAGRKILARCPFREQFCNIGCPLLIVDEPLQEEQRATYCSLSVHSMGRTIIFHGLYPSESQI